MASPPVPSAPPHPPLPTGAAPPPRRSAQVTAWLLLGCWSALAALWLLAPTPADWSDLEEAAARGDISHIEVSDHAQPPTPKVGQRHRSIVRVTWKHGWRTHTTEVMETLRHRSPDPVPLAQDQATFRPRSGQHPTARMRNVRAQLATLAPDVPVTAADDGERPTELLGRNLPSWAGVVSLVVMVGSFAHLITNPRPQRATRWAWFWLWCIPGLGAPAYLLGSGATLRRSPTNERIRGLTGFVILLASSAFLSTVLF